jgi:hypothetical protein
MLHDIIGACRLAKNVDRCFDIVKLEDTVKLTPTKADLIPAKPIPVTCCEHNLSTLENTIIEQI